MTPALGLDCGSVAVKAVVLDGRGDFLRTVYRRHAGRPLAAAREVLSALRSVFGVLPMAVTGSTGRLAAAALGVPHVGELAALAAACSRHLPHVRAVFEMGGEDAKFLALDDRGSIADFALNSVCAAGTGSFLDQQAERMLVSIEDFAAMAAQAMESGHGVPRIAGRCSVFAKSDMIHLQQIGTPVDAIAAGLCLAVARNYKGSILRGRVPRPDVAFLGGVALNEGVVRAFGEVFAPLPLIVPDEPVRYGAAGAILKALADGSAVSPDPERLAALGLGGDASSGGRLPRLVEGGDGFDARHGLAAAASRARPSPAGGEGAHARRAFLGIDVGSISTNLALLDEEGALLAKRYLRTSSRPVEVVRAGLADLGEEVARRWPGLVVAGVGTTGSGRYLIADLVRADVVKNEITAQARASAHIDPKVDTIFEIGGQDSKFISLKDGVIVDFEMNKACAAGTGSFLEEQAERIGVSVKDEFAALALQAPAPCRLGERCTVFMENSLREGLTRGQDKGDLLAGLAYSIVENYLGRVVSGRRIGERVFFQGGTAFNKAVVAAFEKHLGRAVTVPPDHDVTGAIGMALIARERAREAGTASAFRGFDLSGLALSQSSFVCAGCENACEINRVSVDGEKKPLFYGGRCEKYEVGRGPRKALPDLFAYRAAKLAEAHESRREAFAARGRPARRGRIGLPLGFFFHDYLPYFSTLFWELGFEPVLSGLTGRRVVALGTEQVLADTCFPVKAAMGHVRLLAEQGVPRLFLPSFINLARPGDPFPSGLACPLTQSFPYQARAALPGVEFVAPPLSFDDMETGFRRPLTHALEPFGVGSRELTRAMKEARAAQDAFEAAIRERGRAVFAELAARGGGAERVLAVIGRPYNAFDPGMNLDIPRKLAALNVLAVPMDFLPVAPEAMQGLAADWPNMYWRSGQRMLAAMRAIRGMSRVNALAVGNFSCGPDSFVLKFLEREAGDKPWLHVEIDEHSADAGVITRLEAFLDSLDQGESRRGGRAAHQPEPARAPGYIRGRSTAARRTIYLPRMNEHAFGLAAAFHACGVQAEVLPETDADAVALARRHVSGKECYPCAVTTGDMLRKAAEPGFDPDRAAFFMPSGTGPCRFGQYNVFQRMILDAAGLERVPLFSPNQNEALYRELGVMGRQFARKAWQGVVAFDLLTKCVHEIRPLERDPGAADALRLDWRERLMQAIAGKNGALPEALWAMRLDFKALARRPVEFADIPRVGIVGEIFVRQNRFSNDRLVRTVEELGGRVWLASVEEWVSYVGVMSWRRALKRRDVRSLLSLGITRYVQRRLAKELEQPFRDFLEVAHEAPVEEVLEKAAPYLHDSFEGEAILSVGKAVEMCERGVSGLIVAMPFGCMPGTVATALLRSVSDRFGVPFIALPFDGTAAPTIRLTLESFMEQVRANRSRQAGEATGR